MKSGDKDVIRLQPWVKPNTVFNYSTFYCDACMKVKADRMQIPLEAMTEYDFVTSQLDMCLNQAMTKAKQDKLEWVKKEVGVYRGKMESMVAWLLFAIHQDKEHLPEILIEKMNQIHMRLIGTFSYYIPSAKSVDGAVREALKDKGIR